MDKYTKFILTVIAFAMIGILFKGEKIISSANAIQSHYHYTDEISNFTQSVKKVVEGCKAENIMTKEYYQLYGIENLSLVIRC